MRWKTPKVRFSLRVLLLLMAVATLPAWWVANQRSEYLAEQRTLQRIKKHAPDLGWNQIFYGPEWFARCGYFPQWCYRVDAIDVTGALYGPHAKSTNPRYPHPFNDADLA